MRWWRKAAKVGDLEGMLKIGLAMYQGVKGKAAVQS
jgi:TPR repeat protein